MDAQTQKLLLLITSAFKNYVKHLRDNETHIDPHKLGFEFARIAQGILLDANLNPNDYAEDIFDLLLPIIENAVRDAVDPETVTEHLATHWETITCPVGHSPLDKLRNKTLNFPLLPAKFHGQRQHKLASHIFAILQELQRDTLDTYCSENDLVKLTQASRGAIRNAKARLIKLGFITETIPATTRKAPRFTLAQRPKNKP